MNSAQNYSKYVSATKVNKLGINKNYGMCSLKQLAGHHLPERQHIFNILLQCLYDRGHLERPRLLSLHKNLCCCLEPKGNNLSTTANQNKLDHMQL